MYNIGGNQSLTIKEILEFLISISSIKKKLKIIKDSNRFRPIDADLQFPIVKSLNLILDGILNTITRKHLEIYLIIGEKKLKKIKII